MYSLPLELKNVIVTTTTISGYGSDDATNFTSNDKLYLLSRSETWGYSDYDTASNETRQLDYYEDNAVTPDNYALLSKNYLGNPNAWWLRTPNSIVNNLFHAVNPGGPGTGNVASFSYGVAPAFRIG